MNAQIKQRLESIGWDALYTALAPNLSPVNASGERRCIPPFIDHNGRSDSLCINIMNGLWHDHSSGRGGDFILFRAILTAEDYDEATGRAIPDYAAAEREVSKELGLLNPIDPAWYDASLRAIPGDAARRCMHGKPWHVDTLVSLGVGFDPASSRFVLPLHDHRGRLVSAKMYRPGATPKAFWYSDFCQGSYLFPHAAWAEPILVLTEGEGDALSLRSHGIAGCSGVLGGNSPVPEGNWYYDKVIYILMDSDQVGESAASESCRRMIERAQSIVMCTLPNWAGKPLKADVSDYIAWMYAQGRTFDEVQAEILSVLQSGIVATQQSSVYDAEPVDLTYSEASSAVNGRQRIRFGARVTARSARRYSLPIEIEASCPGQGHAFCSGCPMRLRHHGSARLFQDARSPDTLKLIQVANHEARAAVMDIHGIPGRCPDFRYQALRSVDIEPTVLNDDLSSHEGDSYERQRREAYMIVRPGDAIEENQSYQLEGFSYAHPKTQANVLLLDRYIQKGNRFENFEPTRADLVEMESYRPDADQSVMSKLLDVADDLAYSVTMIRGRSDLHMAYRTLWHSVLNFKLYGSLVGKGWLEMLVLGDTRCGKSATFRAMSSHLGVGAFVDCKMQSIPGVLGSVIQMPTGEYYAVAGLLPQQDGGVVCLDEFPALKFTGSSLIETLSSTRSEGVVRITKAASAEFRCRVRMAWLANPGRGKLMDELSSMGCEIIHDVIPQPEDIARFDFAVAVAQADVPVDDINTDIRPLPSRYSRESARNLISWTYSRKTEQIRFTEAAEATLMDVSRRLCHYYDSTIPLVEPAEQRKKVAKMAVSIAAQTFSTDPTYQLLIVHPSHVMAAEEMLNLFYTKPSMGYNLYSEKSRGERNLQNPELIRELMTEVGTYSRRLAEELLRLDEFNSRAFASIVPMQGFQSFEILQQLYSQGCIRLIQKGRKGDVYEKTPAFISFLRAFISSTATTHQTS